MFKVLFDCVLVRVDEPDETLSSGGIVLTNAKSETTLTEGVVVSVGEGKRTEQGALIKPTVSDGDTVLFNKSKIVDTHTIDGKEHLIIRESNIVAIV